MKYFYTSYLILAASHLLTDAMHGGDYGGIEKVPYTAQVYNTFKDGGINFCGAVIISERWLLSAAHCVSGEDLLYTQMRLGTNDTLDGGELYNISKIIVHPKYFTDTRWNSDICLIKLEEAIKFDETRQPIPISKKTPQPGTIIDVSGYGYDYNNTYEEHLKFGRQAVIEQNDCRKSYDATPQKNVTIDNRVFCVNPTDLDLCAGDSGSPGVSNGKIYGIAVEGCESPLPNLYVNVAHYYSWIVEKTGLKFD